MSKLPQGWVSCSAGELVQLVRGVSYDKAEVKDKPHDGYVPVLRATNIEQALTFEGLVYVPPKFVSEDQILRVGDIVVAASSGSKSVVGKAAQLIQQWSGSFGAFCMGIRPSTGVNARYLGYFFQSPGYRQTASRLAAGSNINNLKREHIADLEFKLPPEPEQQRIVGKLEELLTDLDAGTRALERAHANLKRYRAAVLKAAVEGRLTEKWRAAHPDVEPASKLLERILAERRKKWEEAQLSTYAKKGRPLPKGWKEKYPEPVDPDVAWLPELPPGWCWSSLDQLAEIVGGIAKGQKRRNGEATRLVAYLRVANVQRGYLDLGEIKWIEAAEDEIDELRLVHGDVLFNEGGDRDKLGRGWVWEEQIPECIHQNHVFRARLVASDVLPKFVSIHGNTFGRMWFQQAGKQSVNLASINMGILKRFPIPLAPAAEQAVAISLVEQQISVLDRNVSIVEREELRAARLRQAVLRRAFEGKLVPQDPKDESASELLARIRAGRAGEGKAKPRARAGNGIRVSAAR